MNWKKLLESVSESVHNQPRPRHDYLGAENRIQGSLKHLGYAISDQTVGNILKLRGIPPAPERKKTVTWGEFVRPHLTVLLATDFFNSNVWSWFRLVISCLLAVLHFCVHQVRRDAVSVL